VVAAVVVVFDSGRNRHRLNFLRLHSRNSAVVALVVAVVVEDTRLLEVRSKFARNYCWIPAGVSSCYLQ